MSRRKGDVNEVFYSMRLREVSARMFRCWGLVWVGPLNLQELEKVGKRYRNCTFSSSPQEQKERREIHFLLRLTCRYHHVPLASYAGPISRVR